MNATIPMIEFRQVTKRFGALTVLKDVNLSFRKAEVVVICGPSGSGKSTLLRSINRLEPIDEGSIAIDGQVVGDQAREINALRQRVGFVFQQFNLFPHLTVTENICLAPMHLLGMDREQARERARALLQRVGLSDKADAYPGRLSGGQ